MQCFLTCPKCNKKYKLTAPDESKLLKYCFSCDRCGFSTPFLNILPHLAKYTGQPEGSAAGSCPATHISQVKPRDTHPTQVSQSADNNATCAHMLPPKAQQAAQAVSLPLFFEVEDSGRRLYLSPGSFILGRDSSDSNATIKVAPDPYMSRECARLDVKLSGSTVRIEITPLKSKNPVCIDNVSIPANSTRALKLGDRVLLGNTTITLKINN